MSPVPPGNVKVVPFVVQGHQGCIGDTIPCPPNKPQGHAKPLTCYWGLGTWQGHGDTRGRGAPPPHSKDTRKGLSPSHPCQRAQDCPQCPQGHLAGCPQAMGDMVRMHQGHQQGHVGDSIEDTRDIIRDTLGARMGDKPLPHWGHRWGCAGDISEATLAAALGTLHGHHQGQRWGHAGATSENTLGTLRPPSWPALVDTLGTCRSQHWGHVGDMSGTWGAC